MIWELRKYLQEKNNHKLAHLVDLYEADEEVKDDLIRELVNHCFELEKEIEKNKMALKEFHEEV